MRKTLATILAGSMLFAGCDRLSKEEKKYISDSNKSIICTILDETYIASGLRKVDEVHRQGLLSEAYSGPSLTTKESIYLLKLESPEGNIFALNVLDSHRTPKETIDLMFNKGDKISFRWGNNWIYEGGLGNKYVESDPAETGYYKEGDLSVTRRADAISRP